MKINWRRSYGLLLIMCLGLTLACVKVDVSMTSPGTNRDNMPTLPKIKPPISIKQLKERHSASVRPRCGPNHSLSTQRYKQQTMAWCWAASTRTVMDYKNQQNVRPPSTAQQCDIVKNVFGSSLIDTNCCEKKISPDFIDAPLACLQGGWPHWVLNNYHFEYEWVDGLFDDWDALTGEICNDHPFISVIQWRGGGKHTLIVNGYKESRAVEVYDPLQDDPQDLTFDEFVGGFLKRQNEFYEFSHDRTYVQIAPKSKGQP